MLLKNVLRNFTLLNDSCEFKYLLNTHIYFWSNDGYDIQLDTNETRN